MIWAIVIGTVVALLGVSNNPQRIEKLAISSPINAVKRLRSKLEPIAARFKIPIEFLMAWIHIESNGKNSVVTSLNERGFFQIMPGKGHIAEKLGLGTDKDDPRFTRLTTDEDYSLNIGGNLVNIYSEKAVNTERTYGLEFYGLDFWKLVKLHHGGIGSVQKLLKTSISELGRPPKNWNEFYNSVRNKVTGTSLKVLQNAEKTGQLAKLYV